MRAIIVHKQFAKNYSKLPTKIKESFKSRRDTFVNDTNNQILSIHTLHGKYAKCFSFNVTGDIRVVYKEIKKDLYIFLAIGSHSELYS